MALSMAVLTEDFELIFKFSFQVLHGHIKDSGIVVTRSKSILPVFSLIRPETPGHLKLILLP